MVLWTVAMAVAIAVAIVGMNMAAVVPLSLDVTGPLDITEKHLETLQDASLYFSNSTF